MRRNEAPERILFRQAIFFACARRLIPRDRARGELNRRSFWFELCTD
jgi:hypothetical protein